MYLDSFEPISQQKDNLCFPVTIKIILDHLCKKHSKPHMKLSVKSLSKLSGYKGKYGGLWNTDFAIDNMNAKHFRRHGYLMNEKRGVESDIKQIKNILDDGNCSAPIVTVHPEYFKEQNKRYKVPEDPDYLHQLVIKKMDGTTLEIVDTLAPMLLKSSNVEQIKTEIKLSNFIKYWDGAQRSLLWIERIKPISSLNPAQKKLTDTLIKR